MAPPPEDDRPADPTDPTALRDVADRETLAAPSRPVAGDGHALVPGAMLGGRFRIVAKLGEGGMGEVYRAEDLRLGQAVALKFLSPRAAGDARHRERLLAEVRLGRQVAHPGVCRLYDIVELGGRTFVVMEYVDGEDLAALLRRIGSLPAARALGVARELCRALAAIHDKGIVHRDLKPGNVMLDASGRVRITDFGLASELGQGGGEIAGTPAYMAPEQLRGEPGSTAGDVYALGLVCFEILSGRRVFAGGTRDVLEARQRPPSLPAVAGVDAAVRGVIERCLAHDPALRPRDARAVLALLPGADALAEAVAAGETPSPEMVAAAEDVGTLAPARALPLVAFVLASLLALPLLQARTVLWRRAPPPLSPEALERRSAGILAAIGVDAHAPGSDRAGWFERDDAYLAHLSASGAKDPWQRLSRPPHPYLYHFRWSPLPLVPRDQRGSNRVVSDDPPPTTAGMAELVLGADGTLRRLQRVPVAAAAVGSPEEFDWSPLLERTGLDAARLQPTEARATAPVDTDRKRAWTGAGPDAESPVRVETASHRGRAVFLDVAYPWDEARRSRETLALLGVASSSSLPARAAFVATLSFLLVLPPFAYLLARRNLRRRRVDLRGALKASTLGFATGFVGRLLLAHHVPVFVEEWATVAYVMAECAFWGLNIGLFYVAVEPYARRRWPGLLIAWNRLLDGRWRDPMVGRDVLVGLGAGAAILLAWHLSVLAPPWLGLEAPQPLATRLSPLESPLLAASTLSRNAAEAVLRAFGALALVVMCRGLLRNDRAAFVAAGLPMAASFLADTTGGALPRIAYAAVATALGLGVLRAHGLLGLVAVAFIVLCGWRLPLTFDPGAFYFGRSLAVLVLLAGLALWACARSLGGQPLLARPLFDEG